jgi:hypothetical protein
MSGRHFGGLRYFQQAISLAPANPVTLAGTGFQTGPIDH